MDIALEWKKLISSKLFENLPYKIELFNKAGQILMTPASNWHGYAQGALLKKLERRKREGRLLMSVLSLLV